MLPLASTRPPRLRNTVRIAFWDDDAPVDDPRGRRLTLRPERSFGEWPGLPHDLPHARQVVDDSPVVVVTLGHLKLSQAIRFLRASRPAERAAVGAPGFLWGTAAARPPFVATVTKWESATAATVYAYGRGTDHAHAIEAQHRRDFHHRSAFIRFAIVAEG